MGVVEIKRKITVFRSFIQDRVTHKNIQLGRFNTALEAALAYDLYVLTYLQEGEETNWSLGRYVGFEAELKGFGIESKEDIKNLDWKLNLIPRQKTKRHSKFKCCTFRADIFASGPVFISTFNYPGSYKTKSFYAESEREVLIQRELYLEEHPDCVSKRTHRNDLLSLFIPQPGQKFIIPRYVNDEGEVVECIL